MYSADPREWTKRSFLWRNVRAKARASQKRFRITTREPAEPDGPIVHVKSYGDVIRDCLDHAEAKAVDAAGYVCKEETRGLLFPPHVSISKWQAIGKETNQLEDRTVGLVGTHEATNVYSEPGDHANARLLDAMKKLGARRLYLEAVIMAERYDRTDELRSLAENTIGDILKGRTGGTDDHWKLLREVTRRATRRWLREVGERPERGSLGLLVDHFLESWREMVFEPSTRPAGMLPPATSTARVRSRPLDGDARRLGEAEARRLSPFPQQQG